MKIKSIKKIIVETPIKFYDITTEKTHSFLIGNSKIHVHNSSLTGALNKLARPFGNALQILDGYGFFGTEVSPDPAAARYTSVKLNSKTNDILNKYKYLTTRELDGPYDPFWMEIPLGLTTSIVGIAVGYKTTILPRKLEHIKEYLEGKRKSLKPHLEGFNGEIIKYDKTTSDTAWLLSANIKIDGKKIHVSDLPPILKYSSILKKMDGVITKFEEKVRIINNSNTKVDISITYLGSSKEEWDNLVLFIKKSFSIIVTESPVFVKDNEVLVYSNIEQYLDDYKWQVIRLKFQNTQWEHENLKFDLEFNETKKLFIEFILSKKRTDAEIDTFLHKYSREIKSKLESLTSRKFTLNEIEATKKLIEELKNSLKLKHKEFLEVKKIFENTPDPTLSRSVNSGGNVNVVSLFETDDISESIDGIAIWNGEDAYDENEINIENDDE